MLRNKCGSILYFAGMKLNHSNTWNLFTYYITIQFSIHFLSLTLCLAICALILTGSLLTDWSAPRLWMASSNQPIKSLFISLNCESMAKSNVLVWFHGTIDELTYIYIYMTKHVKSQICVFKKGVWSFMVFDWRSKNEHNNWQYYYIKSPTATMKKTKIRTY